MKETFTDCEFNGCIFIGTPRPKFIILHDRFGNDILVDLNCITYAKSVKLIESEFYHKVKEENSVLNIYGHDLFVSETVAEIYEKIKDYEETMFRRDEK